MADFLCQSCKKTVSQAQRCDKCGKILCDTCREGRSACKDTTHGTAGCSGHFQRL